MKYVAFAIAIALTPLFSAIAAEPDIKPGTDSNKQPEPTSLHVTNTIGQEMFVARLVNMRTTLHRRFKWAMTFERLTDGKQFYLEVWDNSPIANALGFDTWEDGQGDLSERLAVAPRVVLIIESDNFFANQEFYVFRHGFALPDYLVVGCFPIDETIPNQRLQLTDDIPDDME